ncbi:MAG: ferredoxin [Bacilli bacterium]|nr:ferredoxin [Bacilli bacterium]
MKLKVNSEACIGCGLCVGTYPDTFEFDDEGKAVVVNEIDDASADDAMANCPVGAIEAE